MAQEINLELLHQELKLKGFTFLKLSALTGISAPHLSMMFAGKRNMTIVKLNKILEATGIEIEKIAKKD